MTTQAEVKRELSSDPQLSWTFVWQTHLIVTDFRVSWWGFESWFSLLQCGYQSGSLCSILSFSSKFSKSWKKHTTPSRFLIFKGISCLAVFLLLELLFQFLIVYHLTELCISLPQPCSYDSPINTGQWEAAQVLLPRFTVSIQGWLSIPVLPRSSTQL